MQESQIPNPGPTPFDSTTAEAESPCSTLPSIDTDTQKVSRVSFPDRPYLRDVEVLREELGILHGLNLPIDEIKSDEDVRSDLCTWMHDKGKVGERTALCLSGGGIRSATFNLGVLQGLAQKKLLQKFTYLSTVSGGGYIGSWLTAWISREQQARDPGLADPDAYVQAIQHVCERLGEVEQGMGTEPEPIKRLRAYSRYLSPTKGISGDAVALVATFLRNLVLNWMVTVPLLMALLALPRLYLGLLYAVDLQALKWMPFTTMFFAFIAIAGPVVAIAFMESDLPANTQQASTNEGNLKEPTWDNVCRLGAWPLSLAALAISILVGWWSNLPPDTLNSLPLSNLLGDLSAARKMCASGEVSCPEAVANNASVFIVCFVCALIGAFVHLAGILLGLPLRSWRNAVAGSRAVDLRTLSRVLLSGALGGLLLGVAALIARKEMSEAKTNVLDTYAVVAPPTVVLLFWLGLVFYSGWLRKKSSEEEREWCGRASGLLLLAVGFWAALSFLVIELPKLLTELPFFRDIGSAGALGAGAVLIGAATAFGGYFSREGPKLRRRAESLTSMVGIRVLELVAAGFIVLLLVALCFVDAKLLNSTIPSFRESADIATDSAEGTAAKRIRDDASARANMRFATIPKNWRPTCELMSECVGPVEVAGVRYESYLHVQTDGFVGPSIFILLCFCLAWLVSTRIGVNAFSLHAMYGNRLVRAYLGASRNDRKPHWFTGFDPQDNIPMAKLAGGKSNKELRPVLFPVLNLTLNLVAPAENRLEWQDRMAMPFTVTPLAAGSEHIGYVRSENYTNAAPGVGAIANPKGISLGRAMTISGAAASPNMGYNTSSALAFVMTLFNIRLGAWHPNPNVKFSQHWRLSEPKSGLKLLISEAFGKTSYSGPFVNLSDGGHFENLGLYEMVRRRCSRIVLCDASCDPDYQFEDLLSSIRKIRIDFGIVIEFPDGLPRPSAGSRLAIGVIRYATADSGAPDGTLYYLKPVLLGDEPGDVAQYAALTSKGTSRFPQQPTSDQFFSEDQFESYRKLGLHSALTTFNEPEEWPTAVSKVRPTPMGTLFNNPTTPFRGTPPIAPPIDDSKSSTKGIVEALKDLKLGPEWLAPVAVVTAIGITIPSTPVNEPEPPPAPPTSAAVVSLTELAGAASAAASSVAEHKITLSKLADTLESTRKELGGDADAKFDGLNKALSAAASAANAFSGARLADNAASATSALASAASSAQAFAAGASTTPLLRLSSAASGAADTLERIRKAPVVAGSASSITISTSSVVLNASGPVQFDGQSIETAASSIATSIDLAASGIRNSIKENLNEIQPRRTIRGTGDTTK